MITEETLSKIIQDTSFNGKYTQFYEMLQKELDTYSDKRIESMKDTLKYVYPKLSNKIDTYDKMKILYEYSLLF